MDERILKWLFDIQEAIKEIDVFFSQKPKEFSHYQSDVMLKRAIERNLEIIGEAINRENKKGPHIPNRTCEKNCRFEKSDYSFLR